LFYPNIIEKEKVMFGKANSVLDGTNAKPNKHLIGRNEK